MKAFVICWEQVGLCSVVFCDSDHDTSMFVLQIPLNVCLQDFVSEVPAVCVCMVIIFIGIISAGCLLPCCAV